MPHDLDKLQGTWNVTAFEADGQTMDAAVFEGARVVIKAHAFTSLGMGGTYRGTVVLDPKKKPKAFDLLFTAGHAAGTRNLGIYQLDGDTWTICLATPGNERPARFATTPGTGLALQTLARGGAPRAARAGAVTTGGGPKRTASRNAETRSSLKSAEMKPSRARVTQPAVELQAGQSGAATPLEGDWTMTAGVFNGVPMSPSMIAWCRRVTRGDITSVLAGPKVMLKARFTLDMSGQPHAIDYVNLEGPTKGKSQAGIFVVGGQTLDICMSPPGKPRPRELVSKKGDGRSHTTWRLAAEPET